MAQIGFNDRWRFWIRGCLASFRAYILINGSLDNEFKITKGVWKGDPLSHFLFIIVMEGLNVAMRST